MSGVWDFLLRCLADSEPAALLQVVAHDGSSPGKSGFRMAVSATAVSGTIGGGETERGLVERARRFLAAGGGAPQLFLRRHEETAGAESSGQICSGSQTVALLSLRLVDVPALHRARLAAAGGEPAWLLLSGSGMDVAAGSAGQPRGFAEHGGAWTYGELLGLADTLHLFGGGHVSLALCRVMAPLGFRLSVCDDRPGLDTMEANRWAHEKRTLPYEEAADALAGGEHEWAVIMTYGHEADERVLRRLLDKPLRYLGLLGSPSKVETMFARLRAGGVPAETLARVRAPIGLPIGSRTAAEIAVSVAAEMIRLRNLGR